MDVIMALVSGILLTAGFPPFDIYPAPWIALVPFLFSLRDKGLKASFRLGIIMGMSYFIGTIYWVYHSMHVYGYLPLYISILIVLLLCFYLSVYVGLFSMLFTHLSRKSRLPALLIAPVIWVTMEYIRTYALTGYPWSLLGYSQYTFLPIIQIADITGVYGISFLIVAVNGAIYDTSVLCSKKRCGDSAPSNGLPVKLGSIILAIAIIASLLYGMSRLSTEHTGSTVKISLVQGNIAQDKKWDLRFQREVIDTYKRLTSKTLTDSPDIIIWPETAVPFVFNSSIRFTREMTDYQKSLDTHLLFGSMVKKSTSEMTNSALLFSDEGKLLSSYDKIHLVPYGEYVPLRKFLPFIDKLTAGTGDFASGDDYVVMETPFARIGNLICYEIIFPGLVRKFADRGANLLVTITNDAWFGRTSAPYQHFSMAVLRAVENRVPVVRAANTGISGFIDSRGRIISQSDIFVEAAFTDTVFIGNERSFYTKHGDVFAYLCIAAVLLFAAGRFSRWQ